MVDLNQKPSDPEQTLELLIEDVAFGGKGIARLDGKVYFVEGAITGDRILGRVTEDSKRYADVAITKILEPSKLWGKSPCPVSDVCGGCQWQGVSYDQQLAWKKQFVVGAFKRIGGFVDPIAIELLPSPTLNHYRNRIFVRARIRPNGELDIGYFKRQSREFVPIEQCLIADKSLNEFIQSLRKISFKDEMTGFSGDEDGIRFRFEMQELPAGREQKAHLLVTLYDADHDFVPPEKIQEKFSKISNVVWVGFSRKLHETSFQTFEIERDVRYATAPGIFQQVNISHNHTLRKLVRDFVEEKNPQRILDVFCGSGNLSLGLADGARRIDGVEFSKRAIEVAKYNVLENKIKNTDYYAGDTEKFLWRAAKQGVLYDLVIADPPREGMYKSLIPLCKINPKWIIYVSCDPTTLARDLGALCKNGYRVQTVKALDFFPNTYHIESCVFLERIDHERGLKVEGGQGAMELRTAVYAPVNEDRKDLSNVAIVQPSVRVMSKSETCPRCQSVFECKPDQIELCECSTIQLTREVKEFIKDRWDSCLCRRCLVVLLKQETREA